MFIVHVYDCVQRLLTSDDVLSSQLSGKMLFMQYSPFTTWKIFFHRQESLIWDPGTLHMSCLHVSTTAYHFL
jgi:hypothetical protein